MTFFFRGATRPRSIPVCSLLASVLCLSACGDDDASTGGGGATSASSGSTGASATSTVNSTVTSTNQGSSSSSSGSGGGGCDPTAAFGAPVPLDALNTSDDEETPRLTPDELTVVFARDKSIWYATRASVSVPFGPVSELSGLGLDEFWAPWIAPDGLTLYLSRVRSSGASLLVASRGSTADDFSMPADAGIDTGGLEWHPFLDPDQSRIWFVTDLPNINAQIWSAPVAGDGTIGTAAVVPELTSDSIDWAPVISADGLEIFFARGASGNFDIYAARRTSTDLPFDPPGPVTELVEEGGTARELPGWLSPDRCRLYFSIGNPTQDLYYAERP